MNALGKTILKDVSRSFYLSMRLLPSEMREPISLAYLLARASDTLADTETLDAELRYEMLEGFSEIIHGGDSKLWLDRLSSEVTPKQKHEGEKRLMENMHGIFSWLASIKGAATYAAIITVMDHILRGQKLDIERFELRDDFQFTHDDELEEYCYLVAGCVGEFWTEIGFLTLDGFAYEDRAKMHSWGADYGKGLQLINILRDLPSDLENGRCYLPNVDAGNKEAIMKASERWRARARDYLQSGATYADALVHRRTRIATALPSIIGERTLDLLDQADWKTLQAGVKISRKQVYRAAWDAFLR